MCSALALYIVYSHTCVCVSALMYITTDEFINFTFPFNHSANHIPLLILCHFLFFRTGFVISKYFYTVIVTLKISIYILIGILTLSFGPLYIINSSCVFIPPHKTAFLSTVSTPDHIYQYQVLQ